MSCPNIRLPACQTRLPIDYVHWCKVSWWSIVVSKLHSYIMCVISIYLKCDLTSWINIIAPIDVKLWGINDDITNRSGQCMMWLKLRASPILVTELLTMWCVKRVWLHYWWKQARDHTTRYSWTDEGVRDLYLAVGSWKTWSKGLSADSIRTYKNRMKALTTQKIQKLFYFLSREIV